MTKVLWIVVRASEPVLSEVESRGVTAATSYFKRAPLGCGEEVVRRVSRETTEEALLTQVWAAAG